MKPTSLGVATHPAQMSSVLPSFSTVENAQPVVVQQPNVLRMPTNFPVVFPEQKTRQIEADVSKFDFDKVSMRDLAMIGSDVEKELHKTLGVFLSKVSQSDQPRLFKLLEQLQKEVDGQDLSGLADKILHAEPGMMDKIKGFFSPKSLARASSNAFENIRALAASKTKTLQDVMAKMEAELQNEVNKLEAEVKNLETVKNAYVDRFMDYAYLTVYLLNVRDKAEAFVKNLEAQGNVDPSYLNDVRAKFETLESRAVNIETMMTKLPADQLQIRMIQNAGVSTLMETASSSSSRFANIKMTLIKLNGALIVQNVQRLGQAGKQLDETLQAVDRKLTGEIVANAANAPGENRIAQAQALQQIITDTKALQQIVEQARTKNAAQFQQARDILTQARADMQQLGTTIHPDQPIGY